MRTMRDLPPIHPGEQLREEFVKPLGLTGYRLAKDIGVPVTRVQAIPAERRGSGRYNNGAATATSVTVRRICVHPSPSPD